MTDFVNADTIAQGLSAFNAASAAMQAGRVMLARLHALARARVSFAFEATLAGRSHAAFLSRLRGQGYRVWIVYVWLGSADLAVKRIQQRVRHGGHAVAEADVRHRYSRSVRNFIDLYRRLADHWAIVDNSGTGHKWLAEGSGDRLLKVLDAEAYHGFEEAARLAAGGDAEL